MVYGIAVAYDFEQSLGMTGVCKQYQTGGRSKSLENNLRQRLYSKNRDPFDWRVAFHTVDHLVWHEMASVCIVWADN